VFPSPQKQGGGGTLACGWGVGGSPNSDEVHTLHVVLYICTYFVGCTVLSQYTSQSNGLPTGNLPSPKNDNYKYDGLTYFSMILWLAASCRGKGAGHRDRLLEKRTLENVEN
jgi:hypothetical protein